MMLQFEVDRIAEEERVPLYTRGIASKLSGIPSGSRNQDSVKKTFMMLRSVLLHVGFYGLAGAD